MKLIPVVFGCWRRLYLVSCDELGSIEPVDDCKDEAETEMIHVTHADANSYFIIMFLKQFVLQLFILRINGLLNSIVDSVSMSEAEMIDVHLIIGPNNNYYLTLVGRNHFHRRLVPHSPPKRSAARSHVYRPYKNHSMNWWQRPIGSLAAITV